MLHHSLKRWLAAAIVAAIPSLAVSANLTGTIPQTTGYIFTDSKGSTWNLDSLLNAGCVVISHQSWAG